MQNRNEKVTHLRCRERFNVLAEWKEWLSLGWIELIQTYRITSNGSLIATDIPNRLVAICCLETEETISLDTDYDIAIVYEFFSSRIVFAIESSEREMYLKERILRLEGRRERNG